MERIEVNGKKHVALAVDPEAAAHCEWLFDTFLENNYTIGKMQTEFRKQGIRTTNGAFFAASRIYKILSTPYGVEAVPEIYDYFAKKGCQMDPDSPRDKWDGTHGVMVYGRSTERNKDKKHVLQPPEKWVVCIGQHKPFLPASKWLAAQERFKDNSFNKTMKYNVPLLKGVVRCARCGCLMAVARKKLKSRILSHYYCRKRNQEGTEACDMRYVKCDILDEKALDALRKIEVEPENILQYMGTTHPADNQKRLKSLESKAAKIQAKIDRLAESLADAEGSTASKHIIAQIEKEDLNLSAIKREIEIAKSAMRRDQNATKTAKERAAEIARLIRGLEGFTDVERNAIVRELAQECAWDGETLFLRF